MPLFFFLLVATVARSAYSSRADSRLSDNLLSDTLNRKLDRPAVSISCGDDGSVFILDGSGETIEAFDPATGGLRTTVLPERILPLTGVRADPLYLYLFNDRNFYRLKKATNELAGPFPASGSDSLRITDLDVSSSGEVFVADGFGDRVLAFDGVGNVRELGAGRMSRPRALRVTDRGEIAVVNSGRGCLSFYNRIGNPIREFPLPGAHIGLLASAEDDAVYLGELNSDHLWRFANGRFEPLLTTARFALTALAASRGRLFVLDAGRRLLTFDVGK